MRTGPQRFDWCCRLSWLVLRHISESGNAVEKRALGGKDFFVRLWQRKPASAVNFRKGLNTSAARRPFHFEAVAADHGNVEVAFERKGGDAFTGPLLDLAEGFQVSGRLHAELFAEFASSRGCRFLVGAIFPFRDRPRAEFLLRQNGPPG